ncbi:type IV pilus twitching motility protein PilT [Trinickia dinghuensis]|uniref:Plasmid transfer ATPase TraJ n=1 Tax=Trinickia dinghuensis TaxID=2291023 RepID=A0A3D8K012_9BURK|nr:ATPase, T2SS/T4P/T4SS family [Trinickia dinghuensis]RDU98753.1 plasmid transfer ATPase TraJ [Trinickia dinghuensis]
MMTVPEPFKLEANFGAHELQAFLAYCTEVGASDIVFQTGDVVWGEIKGRQIPLTERTIKDGEIKTLLAVSFGSELIGVIKSGNDADRPYRFVIERDTSRYRVNIAGAQIGDAEDGLSITMRTIPEIPPPLDALDIPAGIRENLFQPRGLVLICGPTGSGKTTLMSSFYADVSEGNGDTKILLYEDPIEFLFTKVKNKGPKIRQMQIGRHIPSFARGIRNAMRCKPTLIGIGEARDAETIGALVEAALTGHGAYGTMHTESVSETISRAIQVFPAGEHSAIASKILGSLRLIVVQILVPTLDGNRRAVREYLYFDSNTKRQMSDMPYTQWGAFLRKVVAEQKQDMTTGLHALLDAGLIDEKSFRRYAGESNE